MGFEIHLNLGSSRRQPGGYALGAGDRLTGEGHGLGNSSGAAYIGKYGGGLASGIESDAPCAPIYARAPVYAPGRAPGAGWRHGVWRDA